MPRLGRLQSPICSLSRQALGRLRHTGLSFHGIRRHGKGHTCSWFKDHESCSCGGYGTVSLRDLKRLIAAYDALKLRTHKAAYQKRRSA